jgi:hypothetical protein
MGLFFRIDHQGQCLPANFLHKKVGGYLNIAQRILSA